LSTRTRYAPIAVGLAVMAMALSSCSSSGGTADNGTSGSPSAGGSSSTSGSASGSASVSGSAASDDLASYRATLAKYTADTTWNGPTAPAKAPASVKVFIISCSDAVEGCRLAKVGAQAAATALKWDQHTIVNDDPSKYSEAMQTALNQGAQLVVLVGIPQEVVSGPIANAHQKKIPVVSVAQYNVAGPKGVDVEVSPDGTAEGKALADAMIVNNNGQVDALFLADAEFGLPVAILKGARAELATCSTCKVESDLNFTAAEIQTTLPTRVTAALQANPKINSVLVGYDPPIPFLAPAIDNAGLSGVKLYSQIGTAPSVKFLRADDVLVADMADPLEWNAWGAIDQGIRLLDGLPLVKENIPIKMLTKDNAPAEGQAFTGDGVNYQAKYSALWGIG
jgi:ribose transport system substrate-binding protein